jgi:hypothetical protein
MSEKKLPINYKRVAISKLVAREQTLDSELQSSSYLFGQPSLTGYVFSQISKGELNMVEESVINVYESQASEIKNHIEAAGGKSGLVRSRLFENGQSEVMLVGKYILEHDNRLVYYGENYTYGSEPSGPLTVEQFDSPESAQRKFDWIIENEQIFQEALDYIQSSNQTCS